jgi:tRNA U34 2-thiouridine synthase MnmA/TrmU
MTDKKSPSAIVLLSGGLDSALAAALLKSIGVSVTAVNFSTGFCIYQHRHRTSLPNEELSPLFDAASRVAKEIGVPLRSYDISSDFLDVVLNPPHGYGANSNPCIDCRILMLKKAAAIMKESGADFVATGEVLGQRPMSQRKDTLPVIERESGLRGRLLRPLCAQYMKETDAEKSGLIDRKKLKNFTGKGRGPQIRLAEELGLKDNFAPTGACCFLTDMSYSRKFQDKLAHSDRKLTMEDVELLMVGRHFRLGEKLKLIIGRRFRENVALERFARGRIRMEAPDAKGPVGIIDECVPDPRQETLCASILARYTDARNEKSVKIALSFPDGSEKTVEAAPLRDDDLLGKYNI